MDPDGPDWGHLVASMPCRGLQSCMVTLDGPVRVQHIGAYVRERRRANRLTQQQLAELAGVGLRFLKELEAGKPTVQLQSVDAVLAVFGKQLGVVDHPRDPVPDDLSSSPSAPELSADAPADPL